MNRAFGGRFISAVWPAAPPARVSAHLRGPPGPSPVDPAAARRRGRRVVGAGHGGGAAAAAASAPAPRARPRFRRFKEPLCAVQAVRGRRAAHPRPAPRGTQTSALPGDQLPPRAARFPARRARLALTQAPDLLLPFFGRRNPKRQAQWLTAHRRPHVRRSRGGGPAVREAGRGARLLLIQRLPGLSRPPGAQGAGQG